MSFRDIGVILNKAMEEKETSKEQAEKVSHSTQAYKLFSEGKSPGTSSYRIKHTGARSS